MTSPKGVFLGDYPRHIPPTHEAESARVSSELEAHLAGASMAYRAMVLARRLHRSQRRRYTDTPYIDYLAEVVGIAMSVGRAPQIDPDKFMAVCWLQDSIEDQGVQAWQLSEEFCPEVGEGVAWLSDMETGKPAERRAASRVRLAKAPDWVQSIKVADLISNTSSILQQDPNSAEVDLMEKAALLKVLTKADARLHAIAVDQVRCLSRAFEADCR